MQLKEDRTIADTDHIKAKPALPSAENPGQHIHTK